MQDDLLYRQESLPQPPTYVTNDDLNAKGEQRDGWFLTGNTYPVIITTTPSIVIPASPMRGYLLLVNNGAVDIDIGIGSPVDSGTGVPIVPGSFYELGPDCAMTYDFETGQVRPAGIIISAIWAVAPAGTVQLTCTQAVWGLKRGRR